MASLIDRLRELISGKTHDASMPAPLPFDETSLARLMVALSHTRDDELSCEEVANRLDEYVDCLAGRLAADESIALMDDHLAMCRDCHEAYDALMQAIDAAGSESPTDNSTTP